MIRITEIEYTDDYNTRHRLKAVKAVDPERPCVGCALWHTRDCLDACEEMVPEGSCFKEEQDNIIEKRENFTVEHWDVVILRWASLACFKTLAEAEAKYNWLVSEAERLHTTARYRIVKHTLTREVVSGNDK